MHGIIFVYLQRFSKTRFGEEGWKQLQLEAGISSRPYSPVQEYPDAEALSLIQAAARLLELPVKTVLEQFGEFLAPGLLQLYAALLHPEWKTIEVIANTEELIHKTVRQKNPGAKPPMLETVRMDDHSIHIMYSSPRGLCALAKGIVRGVAKHFDEEIVINDEACMIHGDPFCSMHVERPMNGQSPSGQNLSHPPAAIEHETWGFNDAFGATAGKNAVAMATSAPAAPAAPASKFPFLDSPRQPDLVGHLGHYRVHRLLGQGGMGMVFQAEDSRLERPVALKVMLAHLATDAAVRQRFVREARAMAVVKNPYIVTIYDVGTQNDIPYLAMELLEGESLDTYRKRHESIAPGDMLRISTQLAEGLAAAHKRGVIHRDIKPNNLWLDSHTGDIKILDFGLARVGEGGADLTEHGQIVGTPAFMAPEQASGQPVDARADLFSLGCVIYWLCTNVSPFQSADALSTMMAIVTRTPPPPHEVNPEMPDELSRLTMKLLEKDPAMRPATSRIVADALKAM